MHGGERHERRRLTPTIEMVAERAGVSIASVSRILNGHTARQATIDAVTKAAAELGYAPNAAAQSLKRQRTEQVAFAIENVGNPVYIEMLRGVEEVLQPAGYRIVLHSTHADPAAEVGVISDLSRRYVDGLIISPIRFTEAHLEILRTSPAAVVVIGSPPPDVPVDAVELRTDQGVAEAVEHLHVQGCQAIGFVNGPVDTVPGGARHRGYVQGLEASGAEIRTELIEEASGFDEEAGERAAERLLARASIDGLVCGNDLLAVGAMRALQSHGLGVPDDVVVTGVDDTYLASLLTPELTSVSLRSRTRGRLAAELLLSRLEDPRREPRRVVITPRLNVRASSIRRRTS